MKKSWTLIYLDLWRFHSRRSCSNFDTNFSHGDGEVKSSISKSSVADSIISGLSSEYKCDPKCDMTKVYYFKDFIILSDGHYVTVTSLFSFVLIAYCRVTGWTQGSIESGLLVSETVKFWKWLNTTYPSSIIYSA